MASIGIDVHEGQALELPLLAHTTAAYAVSSLTVDDLWRIVQDGRVSFVPDPLFFNWNPYNLSHAQLADLQSSKGVHYLSSSSDASMQCVSMYHIAPVAEGIDLVASIFTSDAAHAVSHIRQLISIVQEQQCTSISMFLPEDLQRDAAIAGILDAADLSRAYIHRLGAVVLELAID